MIVLNGKQIASDIQRDLQVRINFLFEHNIKVGLGVIIVGNSPESLSYVYVKRKKCFEMGIVTTVYHYQE